MSRFRPTRASPPSRPANVAHPIAHAALSAVDISHSSVISVPELKGLSQEEIDLLDSVIERADPSATTFLTVFKAYNDVLNERGLDPHEVLYYGKLLKLGTLKGKNWGEKWSMVKAQHSYGSNHNPAERVDTGQGSSKSRADGLKTAPERVNYRLDPSQHIDDTITLHSHDNGSDLGSEADPSTPQYHLSPRLAPRRPASPYQSEVSVEPLDLDIGNLPLLSAPKRLRSTQPVRQPARILGSGPSEITDDSRGATSTTPPSYRAAVREHSPIHQTREATHPPTNVKALDRKIPPTISSTAARKAVLLARERKGSVVNEDDAWKNIKMQRDEKDADRFRDDKLMERCWEVWKQGFEWIITTNQQIGEARDNLLVRLSLQRWQNLMASRQELYTRITTLANTRRQKSALSVWRAKLQQKQQAKWRHAMRVNMKTIREKREGKLRKDAWAKWRQSYQSHLSSQHYAERLVLKFYRRWEERLSRIDHFEATADEVSRVAADKAAQRSWNHWRKATDMRRIERAVIDRVDLRLMAASMSTWKKKLQDHHVAAAYHNLMLLKSTIKSWKTARDRIRAMENRADKHVARQDNVLLHAVSRVWKARERGKLLERVKSVRILKDVWGLWRGRMSENERNADLALAFSSSSKSYVVSSAFEAWRQVHATHKNAHSFAEQYRSTQLRYKMLLLWRIQLREKLKMVKVARMADRFFSVRQAWRAWRLKLAAKKRERLVKELETKNLRKNFLVWLRKAQQQKQRRFFEQAVQDLISKRIMQTILARWTNRTIEIKLRELEVLQRYNVGVQAIFFKKWKNVCIRHAEELSLMESYQFVKREENMKRLFHRWLSASRATRHRRIALQQKEDDMKLSIISVAWDRWRDRFSDEKLRPIEYDMIVQMQRNLLFRSFGIWHSKTKTLPAIRFHADHTKAKFYMVWKRAMPQALKARTAREIDKKAVLSRCLDKWVQTHRTKMALKAVARARYLRLPTATPRQTASSSRPKPAITTTPLATRNAFPRRHIPSPSVKDDDDSEEPGPSRPPPLARPFSTRTGIASLLTTKPRSEINHPLPKLGAPKARDPSPARSKSSYGGRIAREGSPVPRPPSSNGGGEVRRGRLWLELREVQRKSRPPSEYSQGKEPP